MTSYCMPCTLVWNSLFMYGILCLTVAFSVSLLSWASMTPNFKCSERIFTRSWLKQVSWQLHVKAGQVISIFHWSTQRGRSITTCGLHLCAQNLTTRNTLGWIQSPSHHLSSPANRGATSIRSCHIARPIKVAKVVVRCRGRRGKVQCMYFETAHTTEEKNNESCYSVIVSMSRCVLSQTHKNLNCANV